MWLSLEDAVREAMRSRYMAFCGPLPVIMARTGGRDLVDVEVE